MILLNGHLGLMEFSHFELLLLETSFMVDMTDVLMRFCAETNYQRHLASTIIFIEFERTNMRYTTFSRTTALS